MNLEIVSFGELLLHGFLRSPIGRPPLGFRDSGIVWGLGFGLMFRLRVQSFLIGKRMSSKQHKPKKLLE